MIEIPDKKYPWESNTEFEGRKKVFCGKKGMLNNDFTPFTRLPEEWTTMPEERKAKIKDVLKKTFQVEDVKMEELPQVKEAVQRALIEKNQKETVYVSGPMESSGRSDFNYPAFNEAAKVLRAEGYTVLNPAETDGGSTTQTRIYYLRKDVKLVASSDRIFMLEGWERSSGARLEVYLARELEIPIYSYQTREEIKDDILTQATRVVNHDRRNRYNHPYENFQKIAKLWEGVKGVEFTRDEVSLMMICVKIAREAFTHTPDNLVDMVGYTLTLEMIKQREAELGKSTNV